MPTKLRVRREQARDLLTQLINDGWARLHAERKEYDRKRQAKCWDYKGDAELLRERLQTWCDRIKPALESIFPTDGELCMLHALKGPPRFQEGKDEDNAATGLLAHLKVTLGGLREIRDRELANYSEPGEPAAVGSTAARTDTRTDDELQVLRIFEGIQYGDLLRSCTPEQWRERCTTGDLAGSLLRPDGSRWPVPPFEDHCIVRLDTVCDYLARAVADGAGVGSAQFDAALRSVESLGDIESVDDGDHAGLWYTRDGHCIEVVADDGFIVEGPPQWIVVKLDGREVHTAGNIGRRRNCGRMLRLTAQGRQLARGAGGDVSATADTESHVTTAETAARVEPTVAESLESQSVDWSEPMSLKDAASRWGGAMNAKKLGSLIDKGTIRAKRLNRQTYQFDCTQIPRRPKRGPAN